MPGNIIIPVMGAEDKVDQTEQGKLGKAPSMGFDHMCSWRLITCETTQSTCYHSRNSTSYPI